MSIPSSARTTNLLTLPLLSVIATTGTNEDWIDGVAFVLPDTNLTPISIAGIDWTMEMRHVAPDATVVLRASLSDSGIIAAVPNFLRMNIPARKMVNIVPQDYVFDILGGDAFNTRRIIVGTLTVVQGITR
jgi:hypothetical protein